jgi:hypothetical protein
MSRDSQWGSNRISQSSGQGYLTHSTKSNQVDQPTKQGQRDLPTQSTRRGQSTGRSQAITGLSQTTTGRSQATARRSQTTAGQGQRGLTTQSARRGQSTGLSQTTTGRSQTTAERGQRGLPTRSTGQSQSTTEQSRATTGRGQPAQSARPRRRGQSTPAGRSRLTLPVGQGRSEPNQHAQTRPVQPAGLDQGRPGQDPARPSLTGPRQDQHVEQGRPTEQAPAQRVLKVDPNVLATLLAQTIVQNTLPQDLLKSAAEITVSRDAQMNGIVKDERTIDILDAIASIAIHKPEKQVVAVAFQMDRERKMVRLTIAENDVVSPHVTDYIKKVWELLKRLSDIYTKNRGNEPRQGYKEESPPIPSIPSALNLMQLIGVTVYQFSKAKILKRAKKWRPGLVEFGRALLFAYKDGSLGGDEKDKELQEECLSVLTRISRAFGWGKVQDDETPPPINDWASFYIDMSEAIKLAAGVLKDPYALERWAEHLGKGKPVLYP